MSSVKHNQSPRCTPLYKPREPPINSGWLGDLSLRADCGAEASGAADIGLNPDTDVSGGLLVSCLPGTDRFIRSPRGGKCPRKAMVLHHLFTTFQPEREEIRKCSQSSLIYEGINITCQDAKGCVLQKNRDRCCADTRFYTTFDQNQLHFLSSVYIIRTFH